MQNTPTRGLSEAEVLARRAQSGWNELPDASVSGPWSILLRQFSSFLIVILVVAAAVAIALGEWIDAAAIGVVVVLNAALGFAQEWRAETALAALRTMMSPKAVAIRDGREVTIPARELVPGDLIALQGGDSVPAGPNHCRLAVGRDYLDAGPVRGVRCGGGDEAMQVDVQVSGEPAPADRRSRRERQQ